MIGRRRCSHAAARRARRRNRPLSRSRRCVHSGFIRRGALCEFKIPRQIIKSCIIHNSNRAKRANPNRVEATCLALIKTVRLKNNRIHTRPRSLPSNRRMEEISWVPPPFQVTCANEHGQTTGGGESISMFWDSGGWPSRRRRPPTQT